MAYHVIFSGSSAVPRLRLNDGSDDLNLLITWAKMATHGLNDRYWHCGIWRETENAEDELVHEFNFSRVLTYS